RLLIALVLAFAFGRTAAGVLARQDAEQHEARERERAEDDRRPERDDVRLAAALEFAEQLGRIGVQWLALGADRPRGLFCGGKPGRIRNDGVDARVDLCRALGDLRKRCPRVVAAAAALAQRIGTSGQRG